MAQDWRNPKIWRLFLRALRNLQRIVEQAHELQDDGEEEVKRIATVFPYRHANSLCWLAGDLRLLVRNEHIAAPPVIARAMLESFFYLAACKSVPNFAARKTIWEMRDFIRRGSNLQLVGPNREWLAAERGEIQTTIERIERHYGLNPNERAWTFAQC